MKCSEEGCDREANYFHQASEKGWCYKHFIPAVMDRWHYIHIPTKEEPKEDGCFIAKLSDENFEDITVKPEE